MTRFAYVLVAGALLSTAHCSSPTNNNGDGGDAARDVTSSDAADVPRVDATDISNPPDSADVPVAVDAGDDTVAEDAADDAASDVVSDDTVVTEASVDVVTADGPDDVTVIDAAADVASVDAPVDVSSDTGPDVGPVCTAAGVECTNYAAALAAAPRGATSIDNCVIQLHQSDCCGATRAYGINHAARTTLCPAETACVAMYPTPAGCTDGTITTDTGETTTNMADVKIRVVSPTPCGFDPSVTCYTCETFVCTTGSCRTAPGIAGGCGP